MHQMASDQRSD